MPVSTHSDQPEALGAWRLLSGVVRVRTQFIQVEFPGIDIQSGSFECRRVLVLQVGFGRGSGDTRAVDHRDERVDEALLVDALEHAGLEGAGLHDRILLTVGPGPATRDGAHSAS